MSEALLKLSEEAESQSTLRIRTLPGRELWNGIPQLLINEDVDEDSFAQARVQVLEEAEYEYSFEGCGSQIYVEPTELFDPDTGGLSGRFRPKRSTGTVFIQVSSPEGVSVGQCEVEVRSRKLDYLSEYRWMLQRIADEAAEAVQSQFAASSLGAFRPDLIGSAETLYQRFAFVQSLLASAEFQGSLNIILNRPHHEYRLVFQLVDPTRGLKAGSAVLRSLLRPGPRQQLANANPLASVPLKVEQTEHEETVDTIPNRFVRHALIQWRYLAREVSEAASQRLGPAGRRGAREAETLATQLDDLLRAPLFKEVGTLDSFPRENTVLQRRPGYRDVFRAYLQVEAAAIVDWAGSYDAFGAGQRNVANLYEYWVFLELARIIDSTPGFKLDRRPLFAKSADKLTLALKKGTPSVLRGSGNRRGRAVTIELWFNREFRRHRGSWSQTMYPDCSLRVRANSPGISDSSKWLHFDAKYRIDSYRQVFLPETSIEDEPIEVPAGDEQEAGPVSADLLKMHAYRDAITRTSGAFVLYPGFDERPVRHAPYHEILPGLGAFVLRPTENGQADQASAQQLRQFVEDAIDHVAALGTDEDRATFWRDRVYSEERGSRLEFEDWVDRPPADIAVLLGFVHGPDHLRWVERTGLYNLRADDRVGSVGLTSPELAAEILCLYDGVSDHIRLYRSSGKFVLRTGYDLAAEEYPHEPGDLYCCLILGQSLVPPSGLTGELIRVQARLGRKEEEWSAPMCISLDELLESVS